MLSQHSGENKAEEMNMDALNEAKLKEASKAGKDSIFSILGSSETGLTPGQAIEKQQKFGSNEVVHEKAPTWYIQLFKAFINPFIGILILIDIVSLITDVILAKTPADRDYTTVLIISLIILLSSIIRFWQEFQSNKAAEELKNMVKTTATVLRQGTGKKEIDIRQLVPGDIVFLSAGDMIPGDCRILHSKDLFISQSIITGESQPVEKSELSTDADKKSLLELENICFMGTNVISGLAIVIIVTTGSQTYFGTISKTLTDKRPETSFDKGVSSVSWLLIRFMVVMVPLVFIINGFTKGNWVEAFLFGIAMAVGLTPAMLPMIVTVNLAKGAVNMSRRKVIVKRLNAMQNIGAMDVLCTDKTGTLTLDKIVLEKHLNVEGVEDKEVLKWAYLNSYYQTGLRSLMDIAILNHTEVEDIIQVAESYKKVDEIPFDSNRRRMSVILERPNGKHLLICKGAVEEMLNISTHAFDPGENKEIHAENDPIVLIEKTMRDTIVNMSKQMNQEGLRVLIVAIKECDARPLNYSVSDECDMVLTGFIGFLDPPKPSAQPSIQALQKLGIKLKVLTGDNDIVTRKICKDIGIPTSEILIGSEIEKMNDDELVGMIEQVEIFAKVSPPQKSRIIKLLQVKGHTVGFLGDGINDTEALHDADIGISVDTAVDIAKESAHVILLEKDLMVLREGVVYGRTTFGNTIKYIKMAASSNFGNMFSMLGASALLPFLPLLPFQLLINNLLYDISQISIPWDRMDVEYIEKPRKWEAGDIARFMIYIGPISSIFDYVTFAIMYFIFKASTPEHQTLFQSGWFVESLLSQTLIVHMIRTNKIPFLQSTASWPVIILTTIIMAIGVYIPMAPFAGAFKMTALPMTYFIWLFAILFSYCLLIQIIKIIYIKKFRQWL